MDNQNLIIFRFKPLYEIIKELEENINFKVFEASNEKILNDKLNNLQNYLIITQKKIDKVNNQFVLNQVPIKISKFIEKLNVQFLINQIMQLELINYNLKFGVIIQNLKLIR